MKKFKSEIVRRTNKAREMLLNPERYRDDFLSYLTRYRNLYERMELWLSALDGDYIIPGPIRTREQVHNDIKHMEKELIQLNSEFKSKYGDIIPTDYVIDHLAYDFAPDEAIKLVFYPNK